MKIPHRYKRILLIFLAVLVVFLTLRWVGKSAVEYVVTNYFHQKLSGSERTTIEYDIGNLHLQWAERSIELDEVEILIDHQETTGETTSYELSLPLFKIDLLSLSTLFRQYTLSIEDIVLEYPRVQVYLPEVQDTVVFREEMGNLQQRTLNFLQQLDLQNFALNHGSFAWSLGRDNPPRYQVRDISVRINNVNIRTDSLLVERMAELALANHMEVTLHNESVLLPDERHTLRFKQLHISSREDMVLIDSLHLFVSADNGEISSDFSDNNVLIPQLLVKGVDFLALYLDNHLLIDTVLIGETDLHIKVGNESVSLFAPAADRNNHALDSINIGRVEIIPSNISVEHSEKSITNTFQVDSATLALDNVTHAPQPDSSFSWNVGNLELQLQNYQSKLADLNYILGFDKLNWSFEDQSFGLDGVTIYPIHDSIPAADTQPVKYLEVPSFTISNLDFPELFFHQRLSGGKISIEQPRLGLVLPGKQSSSKKTPVDISLVLQQFFESFRLEELTLENGHVALFHERGPAFLTLENVRLWGDNWLLDNQNSSVYNFPAEAFFSEGHLRLPDYQIELSDAHYSSTSDRLTARQIELLTRQPTPDFDVNIMLEDLTLGGLISLLENNELDLISVKNAQASVQIPVADQANSSNSSTAVEPVTVHQLKIDQLNGHLDQGGTTGLSFEDAMADIRELTTQNTGFPISFDPVQSRISFNNVKFNNLNLGATLTSMNLIEGTLSLKQFQAQSAEGSEGKWHIAAPHLELNRWQFPHDQENTWSAEKIYLRQPIINITQLPRKKDTVTHQTVSSRWMLDTLIVDGAAWSVKTDSAESRSPNTSIYGYDLALPISDDGIYQQNLTVAIRNFSHTNLNTELNIAQLEAVVPQQTVNIIDASLAMHPSSSRLKELAVNAKIAGIRLRTSNLEGWNFDQPWTIEELLLDQPDIEVRWDSVYARDNTTAVQAKPGKFPIPSITVEDFQLKQAALRTPGQGKLPSVAIQGLHLAYQDFQWDSRNKLQPSALFAEGNWVIHLDTIKSTFSQPTLQAQLHGLTLTSTTSKLSWDSLRFAPEASALDYSEYLTHQQSWMALSTGPSRIRGLNWSDLVAGKIKAENIKIMDPNIRVFRDQKLPFPEDHYPPLLHEALLDFKRPLHLDTLELLDGSILVEVLPVLGSNTGKLHFTNVEAIVTNITNLDDEINQNKLLKVDAFAQLEQTGLLKAQVDFDLSDPNYQFFTEVDMGSMDLKELNSMIEPVAAVRIKKGNMRNLNFKVMANDKFAYGNMDFVYRKLKLSVLNRHNHDRRGIGLAISSFLANSLVLRRNNDYPFAYRQGQVFIERDDTKSIFNYWGKIAISGILTSAGVKSNRKALKDQYENKRLQLESDSTSTSSAVPQPN